MSYELDRHALEQVRTANPSLPIIARTHSEVDAQFLREAGVELALISEREPRLKMAHYVLTQSGIEKVPAERSIEQLRAGKQPRG